MPLPALPPHEVMCPASASAGASVASVTSVASVALGGRPADERLAFIAATLDDQARRARTWRLAWAIGGGALAAGTFVFAGVTPDHDARTDAIVSGIATLTIPLSALALPLRVEADAPLLARYAAAAPPCIAVAHAEALLAADAEDEASSAGPLAHALAIAGNGALALVLGLGFGHWASAALNGLGGLALSEAQILTQPTGAIDAERDYLSGRFAPFPGRSPAPLGAAHAPRIGFTLAF